MNDCAAAKSKSGSAGSNVIAYSRGEPGVVSTSRSSRLYAAKEKAGAMKGLCPLLLCFLPSSRHCFKRPPRLSLPEDEMPSRFPAPQTAGARSASHMTRRFVVLPGIIIMAAGCAAASQASPSLAPCPSNRDTIQVTVTDTTRRVTGCDVALYFNRNLPVGTVVTLTPRDSGYTVTLEHEGPLKDGRGISISLLSETDGESRTMEVPNAEPKKAKRVKANPSPWFRKDFKIREIAPDSSSDRVAPMERRSGFVILSN